MHLPLVLDTMRLWLHDGSMPSSQVYLRGRHPQGELERSQDPRGGLLGLGRDAEVHAGAGMGTGQGEGGLPLEVGVLFVVQGAAGGGARRCGPRHVAAKVAHPDADGVRGHCVEAEVKLHPRPALERHIERLGVAQVGHTNLGRDPGHRYRLSVDGEPLSDT